MPVGLPYDIAEIGRFRLSYFELGSFLDFILVESFWPWFSSDWQALSCSDHELFCPLFSTILVVLSSVAIPNTFLVSDQLHLSLLIHVPCDCILVGIIPRVAFGWSIAGLVVVRIKIGFLLLSSIPQFVAIKVPCLGWCLAGYANGCCCYYDVSFQHSIGFRLLY